MPLGTLLVDLFQPALLPEQGGDYAHNYAYFHEVNEEYPATLYKVGVHPGLADDACMDGSDPVFYVRAGPTDTPHSNDWIILLPGGGGLDNADMAVEKWVSEYGEMSSLWAPPEVGTRGIFYPDADNPFKNWNVVIAHKCTYDRFMGRNPSYLDDLGSSVDATDYSSGAAGTVTLSSGTQVELKFRGHDVVDAIIDTLAAPAPSPAVVYTDADGVLTTMPKLSDAVTVLFFGHSGGAKGATMIIDDVAAKIRSHAPAADVRLVNDAGYFPSAESVINGASYPGDVYPTIDPNPDAGYSLGPFGYVYAHPLAWTYQGVLDMYDSVWLADLDATCVANDPETATCADVSHVLMNWVETPMFVRQDLADANHAAGTGVDGARVENCWQVEWQVSRKCYGTTLNLGGAVIDMVDDMASLTMESLTHTTLGTTLTPPSGFFPTCGLHNGASTDKGFDSTLTNSTGVYGSYAETLWLWYRFPNGGWRPVEATPPDQYTEFPLTDCPPDPEPL